MSDSGETTFSRSSQQEADRWATLRELFDRCPIPDDELLGNLGLFASRQTLSRWLFMHELYRRILDVHGVVFELGCRWGQNLALFSAFRGMYEPYNYARRIVGFDTFAGFPAVTARDGDASAAVVGGYGVTSGYEEYLERVLAAHEQESPIAHIPKHELVKGDVTETLGPYLDDHPETIVALAYFDVVLYEPTKHCLELIRPYLTRGSVLGFNQLTYADFPGETVAFREVLGAGSFSVRRSRTHSLPSYVVVDALP